MLKPLYWMFKLKDFRYYILYFGRVLFFCILLVAVYYYLLVNKLALLIEPYSNTVNLSLYIIGIIFLLFPFFVAQGYFWELVYSVINREYDVKANSVYSGKIKNDFTITFPEYNFQHFLWRAFASIVANLIMIVPLVLFTYLMFNYKTIFTIYDGYNPQTCLNAIYVAIFLYCLFIPALLRSYANTDSILAPLNITHAIYIVGNYTFRYITKALLFAIYNTFLYIIYFAVINYFILQNQLVCSVETFPIAIILTYIIIYAVYLHSIFVNAYLLGTITNIGEN